MMSTLIDLSGPLFEGMWSYNALPDLDTRLPEYEVEQVTWVDRTGFESYRFVMSSTTGTYLETSAHVIDRNSNLGEGAPLLDDLAPTDFIRPAVVCHVPRKEARQLIRRAELEAHCPPVQEGDALLIECGWGAQWRSPNYVSDGPSFHPDCLPWLLDQPFSLLGVDVPCIQSPWPLPDGAQYSGNMLLPVFQRGILLVAPLVDLDRVQVTRGELMVFPLRVEGVSGAPCRAVFRTG
jgi:kynurenine formamidase